MSYYPTYADMAAYARAGCKAPCNNPTCLEEWNILRYPWRQYTGGPSTGSFCYQGQCGYWWTDLPPNRYMAGPVQRMYRLSHGPCYKTNAPLWHGARPAVQRSMSGQRSDNLALDDQYPSQVAEGRQPLNPYNDIYYPLPGDNVTLMRKGDIGRSKLNN